ncbi:hypothetical protein MTR_2g030180 [Medicago truncatula]|uniref:Uncharacterized protein n=1 Tax=Medicago truncatula TaxID=3880 RepID=G7IKU4_MEDTR|nr:hypothetical protein MTR_2g030180 [Medicago truncatula]
MTKKTDLRMKNKKENDHEQEDEDMTRDGKQCHANLVSRWSFRERWVSEAANVRGELCVWKKMDVNELCLWDIADGERNENMLKYHLFMTHIITSELGPLVPFTHLHKFSTKTAAEQSRHRKRKVIL